MRRMARALTLGALLLAGCSSNTSATGVSVLYARVDLLNNAGVVTSSVDLVSDGSVGPSVPLTRNVAQRFRVTWFAADSTPDPAAADPSLGMRVAIPNSSYGLTFAQSPSTRYEGTITGTIQQPSPVFIPLQLFDNRNQLVVFSILAHFVVN